MRYRWMPGLQCRVQMVQAIWWWPAVVRHPFCRCCKLCDFNAAPGVAACPLQYKTEELQRVLVAQPGKFYTLEGCVSTTATYGDTFRVITRTRCCR